MAKAEPRVRPAHAGDAEALAAVLRGEDAAEVRAGGHEPLEALQASVAASHCAFALELGGELACLFGLRDGPRETALGPPAYQIPWLLTGPAVARFPVAFMKVSRAAIATFLVDHPLLVNLVDARYTAALRWAWHLGAAIGDAVPVQPSGLPFLTVTWRAPWAIH